MNILYGETYKKDNSIILKVLDKEIILPKDKAKILNDTNNLNTKLIVGIRPENISCKEEDLKNESNTIFKLDIDITENLGAETYIYAKAGSRNMVIKTPTSDNISTIGKIRFVIDIDKIHLFDENEQKTIF
ncbi:ABC transporter protein [Candidatus Arthromitus sp. SFB-3]|nr:ABC transporter protein [Candidatus Arthromitus sp. SFB-3]